jgi:hypothetical protein
MIEAAGLTRSFRSRARALHYVRPTMSREPQELEHLRLRAFAEGEALANRLAASIVLDVSWFHCVNPTSLSIRKLVEPMSQDPKVVEDLARACADAALARLQALLRAHS